MPVFSNPGPKPSFLTNRIKKYTSKSPAHGAKATLNIPSNTTIQGPATLTSDGTILQIADADNIIIRGIRFHSQLTDHPACQNIAALGNENLKTYGPRDSARCGVGVNIIGNSHNIWIDHNTFFNCGDKCIEVWAQSTAGIGGEALVNGRIPSPDLITISNNFFRDSYFGMAIGVNKSTRANEMPAAERVTVYRNRFLNVFRRSVRVASLAWVHEFNNLIQDWGGQASCARRTYGFGPASVGSAQMLLENNILEAWPGAQACKQAVGIADYNGIRAGGYDRGMGLVAASGNATMNGALVATSNPSAVFDPHAYYAYTPLPATSSLYNTIMVGAGAGK